MTNNILIITDDRLQKYLEHDGEHQGSIQSPENQVSEFYRQLMRYKN